MEAPYLYKGLSYADESALDPRWIVKYQDALEGKAAPLGGHDDVQRHVGVNSDIIFTSLFISEEGAEGFSQENFNGPGVVLRIPNANTSAYSRVPGVSYPYPESVKVTLVGIIEGADIRIGDGPWMQPGL